jgi:hypothetical protein
VRWECGQVAVYTSCPRNGGKRGKSIIGFPRFPRAVISIALGCSVFIPHSSQNGADLEHSLERRAQQRGHGPMEQSDVGHAGDCCTCRYVPAILKGERVYDCHLDRFLLDLPRMDSCRDIAFGATDTPLSFGSAFLSGPAANQFGKRIAQMCLHSIKRAGTGTPPIALQEPLGIAP